MPPAETSNQTNPLTNALLLAATGGLLDAVVFLNHGHVFANAMSGNVVFLGIAAVSRDWGQIIPHLVPIGGFLVGVTTSKQVRYRLSEHSVLLLGLAAESLALFALGWLPADFPDMAFTAIIAFVSAFQAASYRHVGSPTTPPLSPAIFATRSKAYAIRFRPLLTLKPANEASPKLLILAPFVSAFSPEPSLARRPHLVSTTTPSGSPNRFSWRSCCKLFARGANCRRRP
jgi:Protein of unknown function (DUF1275)